MDVSTVCPVALFEAFAAADTFREIMRQFEDICVALHLDPLDQSTFYERAKKAMPSWKSAKLWELLDARAAQPVYKQQQACRNMKVLVIGAGPCGLRSAIECALLGARVTVVEARDTFSRNNVLHLWPFVITDLKKLGAKLFYPKFCAGALDHISIRQLQCVLLKVALMLGVEVLAPVSFNGLILPALNPNNGQKVGWRAEMIPEDHYSRNYEFNAIIAADGKRNSLPGFPRREMRGKLALGITANFVNNRTHAEERVAEISGVAFVFNQQFFKDMTAETGIALENVVYYKDETHYFVMCAKKASLLSKGVLRQDHDDVQGLLHADNVDNRALQEYARQAADFATGKALPDLEYSVNAGGQADVAMFDFTSLFSAEVSCRVLERNDCRLLMGVVGDSLHEPFWPTGSGCARGFLGVFDFVWLMQGYACGAHPVLELLAEREQIYRKLAQCTAHTLHQAVQKYTIDPRTRYPSLDVAIKPEHVEFLVDTDNEHAKSTWMRPSRHACKTKGSSQLIPEAPVQSVHEKFYLQQQRTMHFVTQALRPYKLKIYNYWTCWQDGKALCALVDRFHPGVIDMQKVMSTNDAKQNRALAFEQITIKFELTPPTDDESWLDGTCEYVDEAELAMFEFLAVLVGKLAELVKQRIQSLSGRTNSNGQPKLIGTNCKPESRVAAKRTTSTSVPANNRTMKQPVNVRNSKVSKKKEEDVLSDAQVDSLLNELGDDLDGEQLDDILAEWDDADEKKERRRRRHDDQSAQQSHIRSATRKSADSYNIPAGSTMYNTRRSVQPDVWKARPAMIEKLKGTRLIALESIVTGQAEKEMTKQEYIRKHQEAEQRNRKLEDRELEEMELKLETAAIGALDKDKREKLRVMTNQDEQMIRAKTADSRKMAADGFVKEMKPELQEFDKGVNRLNDILHNHDRISLAEKKTVSGYMSKLHTEQKKLPPSAPRAHPARAPNTPAMRPSQPLCLVCTKAVYLAERVHVEQSVLHKMCFRCAFCLQPLRLGNCTIDRSLCRHPRGQQYGIRLYCSKHSTLSLVEKVNKLELSATKLNVNGTDGGDTTNPVRDRQSSVDLDLDKQNEQRLKQLRAAMQRRRASLDTAANVNAAEAEFKPASRKSMSFEESHQSNSEDEQSQAIEPEPRTAAPSIYHNCYNDADSIRERIQRQLERRRQAPTVHPSAPVIAGGMLRTLYNADNMTPVSTSAQSSDDNILELSAEKISDEKPEKSAGLKSKPHSNGTIENGQIDGSESGSTDETLESIREQAETRMHDLIKQGTMLEHEITAIRQAKGAGHSQSLLLEWRWLVDDYNQTKLQVQTAELRIRDHALDTEHTELQTELAQLSAAKQFQRQQPLLQRMLQVVSEKGQIQDQLDAVQKQITANGTTTEKSDSDSFDPLFEKLTEIEGD